MAYWIYSNKRNEGLKCFQLFYRAKNEFSFSQFKLTSGQQKIEFTGNIIGDTEKTLLADFTKVKLQSFMPEIDSLALKGRVSGNLDFVQKDNVYSPEATLLNL